MNKSIKNNTPYDYTIIAEYGYYPNGTKKNDGDLLLPDVIPRLQIDPSYIKSQSILTTYTSELKVSDKNLMAHISDKTGRQLIEDMERSLLLLYRCPHITQLENDLDTNQSSSRIMKYISILLLKHFLPR